jgi:hypothetical protein
MSHNSRCLGSTWFAAAAYVAVAVNPAPLHAQTGMPPAMLVSPAPAPPAPRPPVAVPVPETPGSGVLQPGGGEPSMFKQSPLVLPSSPTLQPAPIVPAGHVALMVTARFGRNAPQITQGLHWRIYRSRPDSAGQFRLVKEEKTAAPTFILPPGGYVVHAGFGLASAVRNVELRSETVREMFELPAGGLRLEGRVGDAKIPANQISFDLYRGSQFEPGEKRPLASGVLTGTIVLVPEGIYHLVSNYGDTNAVIRSDIRVQAGRLTDVTVSHRAAAITLKLVNDRGGEALANTAWSVLTPGGDVIKESIGAFPRVILQEGEYRVIARNEGRVFERQFKVIAGVDGEIEVMAR